MTSFWWMGELVDTRTPGDERLAEIRDEVSAYLHSDCLDGEQRWHAIQAAKWIVTELERRRLERLAGMCM